MTDLTKLIEWTIDKAFAYGITSAGIGSQDYNNGDIKRVAQRKAHQILREEYERGVSNGRYMAEQSTRVNNCPNPIDHFKPANNGSKEKGRQ